MSASTYMDTKEIIFGPKPQPAKDFHAKVSANFRLAQGDWKLTGKSHFNEGFTLSIDDT